MVRLIVIALIWSVSWSAVAADFAGGARSQCVALQGSSVLELKRPALTETLSRYRDEAVAKVHDKAIVFSSSAVFDWAVATTVQCNVALGYLAGGHVDPPSSQKCDCFHGYMMSLL